MEEDKPNIPVVGAYPGPPIDLILSRVGIFEKLIILLSTMVPKILTLMFDKINMS